MLTTYKVTALLPCLYLRVQMESLISVTKISRVIDKAKVYNFSKTWVDGDPLNDNHRLLYLVEGSNHLGKLSRGLTGKQPTIGWYDSYGSSTRTAEKDIVLSMVFVYDADDKPEIIENPDWDSDGDFRAFVNRCYDTDKEKVPFGANVARGKEARSFNTSTKKYNSEALVNYKDDTHRTILLNIVSQWLGKTNNFECKTAINWNYSYKQEDDVIELMSILMRTNICLYAAYTSRGKTLISLATTARMLSNGGIALVTTPVTDTLKSFYKTIDKFYLSNNREQKVTALDSVAFKQTIKSIGINGLCERAKQGELIIILLSVQDLRYDDSDDDSTVDNDVIELRQAYSMLSGNVDLWIRDEFHKEYGGEVTSKRLATLTARRYLDLTATPYSVLNEYKANNVLARTLLWGLKHAKANKLPKIRIEGVSEAMMQMDSKFADIYTDEEGWDPRKNIAMSNGNFTLSREWTILRDRWYLDSYSKKKNPLSIANDSELSEQSKRCGMIVCPPGQGDAGASVYLPMLASLLNTGLPKNSDLLFIDADELEKCSNKSNQTIGEYVESLVNVGKRVVILTCGKFLTGTDIKPLGHIILMRKMESISNFEQLMGRMIRPWPGKDEVKLYNLQPNQELMLTYSEWTKTSSLVSGGSQMEYFDSLPLSMYDLANNKLIKPSSSDILTVFQEYATNNAKKNLPSQSLARELELVNVEISGTARALAKEFKKNGASPTAEIGGKSNAKVGQRTSVNPKTGAPFTSQEKKDQAVAMILLQQASKYAPIFAVGHNNYDVDYVYNLSEMKELLSPIVMELIIEVLEQSLEIKQMVQQNLNEKKLAFDTLPFEDVCDHIFINDEFLKGQNLVFINNSTADHICNNMKIPKKFKGNIVIGNSLNGIVPIKLKKMYPHATIYCYEYFNYFKNHLERLGFVVNTNEEIIMKRFDYGFINPPYMKGKWKTFITELYSKIDKQFVTISPDPTEGIGTDTEKWIEKSKNMGIQTRTDVTEFFPTVQSGKISLCSFNIGSEYNPNALIRSNQIDAEIIAKLQVKTNTRYCARGTYEFMTPKLKGVKRNKNKDMLPNNATQTETFKQLTVVSVGKNKLDQRYFSAIATNSLDIKGHGFVINRSFGSTSNDPVYLVTDSNQLGFSNNVIWHEAYENETVESFKSVFGSKLYRYFFKTVRNGALDIQARLFTSLRCPALTKVYSDKEIYDLNNITDHNMIAHIEANYE